MKEERSRKRNYIVVKSGWTKKNWKENFEKEKQKKNYLRQQQQQQQHQQQQQQKKTHNQRDSIFKQRILRTSALFLRNKFFLKEKV